MGKLTFKLTLSGLILSMGSAVAADFDGSMPLLCASIETAECNAGADCSEGTVEHINVPQFLRINFQQQEISGPKRTTKIQNMAQVEGKVILQGVESGLGWSMAITQETGKMALTASGDQIGFVVFGACTPL